MHNRVEIPTFGENIFFPYKQSNKGFRTTGKGTLSFSFSAERKKEHVKAIHMNRISKTHSASIFGQSAHILFM